MAGAIDARLEELGIELPEPAAPVANYVAYVVTGNLIFVSGQVPIAGGEFKYVGKVGGELSVEDGQADWDRIMTVNLKSMFLVCKHVLPVMRAQGGGAIVNISSTAALWSGNDYLAYNTAKAGVNALTRNLALENARYGVRANAIMPGLMNTPMAIEGISSERGIAKADLIAERDAAVPLGGKMGSAWDVAHAALFLAGDEARFITGAIRPVEGGLSLRRG